MSGENDGCSSCVGCLLLLFLGWLGFMFVSSTLFGPPQIAEAPQARPVARNLRSAEQEGQGSTNSTPVANPHLQSYIDKKRREVEKDLADFANAEIPELQSLLDDMSDEHARWRSSAASLRTELLRLGRDPNSDPDYLRWTRRIETIEESILELKEIRENAFIDFRKIELSPVRLDTEDVRSRRFEGIRARVAVKREDFARTLKRLEDGDTNPEATPD